MAPFLTAHCKPYTPRVKFRTAKGTYPALVTNPTLYGMGGFSQEKSRTFQQFNAMD